MTAFNNDDVASRRHSVMRLPPARAVAMLPLALCVLATACAAPASASAARAPRFPRVSRGHPPPHARFKSPISQCDERRRDAPVDHFSFPRGGVSGVSLEARRRPRPRPRPTATYSQRYFVCARHARGADAPLFFYVGNEADVELYVNNTGLMWELAPEHGAALVFAEHRGYGRSPLGDGNLAHLTSEQAMADYATLIAELKTSDAFRSSAAVIAFGGSYGGMLSTWMRLKYPWLVAGAIAGSAPIWSFDGESPRVDAGAFAEGVTHDASEDAGANAACVGRVRAAFATMLEARRDDARRERTTMRESMRLCDALRAPEDVDDAMAWAQDAFDYMAMGNYPYPSSYILNGDGTLPAYPMRVACDAAVGFERLSGDGGHGHDDDDDDAGLLSALADAVGVFYNHSGDAACFDIRAGVNEDSRRDGDGWDWQFCTEQFMPSSRDGERDMFWKQPWNESEQIARCEKRWGVTPRVGWATTQFGGRRLSDASRIAWSNGDLDPWSRLGVNANVSDSLVAVRLVPIRPRTRCERRSLRSWTFPVVDRSSPALHFQRTFDRVGPFQPPFRLMRRVARFVVRFPFAAARITWTSCGATLTTSRA
jgi:lysosomal Pro-X carboxypeptidase|eukprot:31057-Pelagococcus_subviridis.AAC.13